MTDLKKKRKITYKSAKAKGRNLQNWVSAKFSEISGIPWGKDLEIASREMGQSGVDIKFYGKAAELFKLSCECKAQESWSLPAWIKQAMQNKKEDTEWILFCKKNFMEPVVVIDAKYFFELYQKFIEEKKN